MSDRSPRSAGGTHRVPRSRDRQGELVPAVLAAVLAVVAVVALVVGLAGQQSAPAPAVEAGGASTSAALARPSSSSPAPVGQAVPSAAADPALAAAIPPPVRVAVPSLSISSSLIDLGLHDDGTLEVPPLEDVAQAGWYDRGPRPGADGPAVLLGHVDSVEKGPGVFFSLGAIQRGAEINVGRADGSVAAFAVDRVEVYPKKGFPTAQVYGDTPGPELRLITCGGAFDSSAHSYDDNIVVYASLTGLRPA